MYILLSVFITPILRHRLNEQFKHGAANTAFLSESITGIGTVKSMAVEPQMRRKLEDHLSSYVHSSFRSQNLSNVAEQISGAHEFIVDLPEGYDNMVGEQGSNLSGGQRQRLAIARALISNPKILIFDEATSALDYESERLIQDNMVRISQGRTVFIIAHRLSTVRQCNRIIVLDKGRIVEQGNHDELLIENGYYARLYGYQSHTPHFQKVNVKQGQSQQKAAKSTHPENKTFQIDRRLDGPKSTHTGDKK